LIGSKFGQWLHQSEMSKKCQNCEDLADMYCPPCQQNYCKKCFEFTHQSTSKKKHLEQIICVEDEELFSCKSHNRPIQSFCKTCEEFTCHVCCTGSLTHTGHQIHTLDEAGPYIEEMNKKQMETLFHIHDRMDETISNLKAELVKLNEKIAATEKESEPLRNAIQVAEKATDPTFCLALKGILRKFDVSMKYDIDKPEGILKEIFSHRVTNPKKVIELSTERDQNILIAMFYGEALMNLKDEKSRSYFLSILNREIRNTREDKIALGYSNYCLGKYYEAFAILSRIHGSAFVYSVLGSCYEKGNGVEANPKVAFEFYKKSNDMGFLDGLTSMGSCYFNGVGVDKDIKEAIRLFQVAADAGHARAQYNLGVAFHTGSGVTKDEEMALSCYTKAATQGFAIAQFYLGVCYSKGSGVPKNLEESLRWFLSAADQGYVIAQYNAALCYYNGTGCEKSDRDAYKWGMKAASQNNPQALYFLGLCFERGSYVDKDLDKALEWYRKAALNGSEDAKQKVFTLEEIISNQSQPSTPGQSPGSMTLSPKNMIPLLRTEEIQPGLQPVSRKSNNKNQLGLFTSYDEMNLSTPRGLEKVSPRVVLDSPQIHTQAPGEIAKKGIFGSLRGLLSPRIGAKKEE
jgi:TPR repeat protein